MIRAVVTLMMGGILASSVLGAVTVKYVVSTSQVVKSNAAWGAYKVNSSGDALFPNLGLGIETSQNTGGSPWAYRVFYSKDVLDQDCFSVSTGPVFRSPLGDTFFFTFEPALALTKASYFEYESNGSAGPSHVQNNEIDWGINLGMGFGHHFSDDWTVQFQYDWVGIRPHRLGSDFANVVNSINGNHRVWTGAWQGISLSFTGNFR